MVQTARMAGAMALAVVTALAVPATAQVKPGSQQGLGLMGGDIPPILQQARADPYRAPAQPACESIPQEILALEQALGPDVDGLKTRTGAGDMAAHYVRGLIPYRGVVRFLTGADNKDKKLQAAATAGYARRGFLRGLEANLHCAQPSETKVGPDTKVAGLGDKLSGIKVAVAQPAPPPKTAPGDEIAQQMLTPAPAVLATPVQYAPAAEESGPVQAHVVYQLVDTVSGRTIVPDAGR
jgi:hypothetical protein